MPCVADNHSRRIAERLADIFGLTLVTADNYDACAGRNARVGRRQSEARRAADDDDDFVLERVGLHEAILRRARTNSSRKAAARDDRQSNTLG